MIKCFECHRNMSDSVLVCKECGALLNRDELKKLFREFKNEKAVKNWKRCVELLGACLKLVPENTKQHQQFQRYMKEAAHHFNNHPVLPDESKLESSEKSGFTKDFFSAFRVKLRDRFIKSYKNKRAYIRIPLLIIAKIIFFIFFVSSAMWVLLLGFTKKRTLISLTIWIISLSFLLGWQRAVVFGILIYFHEIGHLLAIQYFGFSFAWPFFVPFLGAFVLHGKIIDSSRESAFVALSGPILGTIASFVLLTFSLLIDVPEGVVKVAYLNLVINVLNLMPFWILDGSRLANLYSRKQLSLIVGGMIVVTVCAFNVFALIMTFCYIMRILLHKQIIKSQNHLPKQKENLWDIVTLQTVLMIVCLLPLNSGMV